MPILPPRSLPSLLLLSLVPIASWFIVRPLLDPMPSIPALYSSIGFSIFAFLATIYLVPALGPTFVKASLSGKDLLKYYDKSISEQDLLVYVVRDFPQISVSEQPVLMQARESWTCRSVGLCPLPHSVYPIRILYAYPGTVACEEGGRRNHCCRISPLSGVYCSHMFSVTMAI